MFRQKTKFKFDRETTSLAIKIFDDDAIVHYSP